MASKPNLITTPSGLCCLISPALLQRITGLTSKLPCQIHGVAADATHFAFGPANPPHRYEIVIPESHDVGLKLAELLKNWAYDSNSENPVIIDISRDDDLVVSNCSVKHLRHS